VSALYTQCPGNTVQSGTGKVDPAQKYKCTTAARVYGKTLLIFFNVSKMCSSIYIAFNFRKGRLNMFLSSDSSVLCKTMSDSSVLRKTMYVSSVLSKTMSDSSVLSKTMYVSSVLRKTMYVSSVLCKTMSDSSV